MKRLFDILVAFIFLVILLIPMAIMAMAVKITSKGPVIYWSKRIGLDNTIFKMPKFRTMLCNAPDVATHLLGNPEAYMTSIGPCLRKYSLDELPQIWSILKGDMSLVGPRPALYNQQDLIEMRTSRGIHRIVPGITGWAQINGRDEISISAKVSYDEYYLNNRSFLFDLKILGLTLLKVVQSEGVRH